MPPVEFIGHVFPHEMSETIARSGPVVQPDYLRALARAHEASGFDRVLIPHSSTMVDGFILADQTLQATERLGVLLAHRPGFIAQTQVARKYATLDAFHPGRIAMHVITGGDDADQARDGDWIDKPSRYRRSGEFLQIVKQVWASDAHLDHEGEFYRVADAWSTVRPATDHIPVYFGGASPDAVRVGAEHADVYAIWGEPLNGFRERVDQIQSAAAEHGRSLTFSVSLRPIVGDSEEQAWQRGREILAATEARVAEFRSSMFTGNAKTSVGAAVGLHGRGKGANEGSKRLLDAADQAEVHDKRLWTALAKATGAAGNSTALVGTVEQIADSLIEYVDAGASTLLIRGYEPYADAVRYGEVIAAVRAKLADREPAPEPAIA